MDLTEAEDIKKRWQEYIEELYKKDIHNPDNHDGVITDLEPNILEFKVKWVYLSFSPWVYLSFSPLSLSFSSLLFVAVCKASSDNHLPFCISFSWG